MHVAVLPFLVLASVSIDDGISPLILQLLQCALCGPKALEQSTHSSGSSAAGGTGSSPAKPKGSKEKKDEKSDAKSTDATAKKKECG